MEGLKTAGATLTAAALVLAFSSVSCTTVNRLDGHELRGAALARNLQSAPAARIDMHYDVRIQEGDQVGTMLSIGTNLAKASVANEINNRLWNRRFGGGAPIGGLR